ncbi:hypothetical protein [Acidovorax sp. FJL06]|uniref:hypothetical protein n=1 Tax=Acidovorax sp. FJL06 TaxID=2153365 RepID=UPI000F570312|nr:hypothetical protein [Acidovorax sp. FJL06]RQO83524.1 hypothetical protein DBV10_04155 [Acidovorax sp. FJL06]
MSAGHTPGPWHRFAVYAHTEILTQTGELVAVVGSDALRANRSPNARLIAAAPDLLEAAQAAWNCIGELPPTQARVEVAQLLQAAIEKAIGVQP